ncbi:MAG: hypothetical protein IJO83_02815 [Clostridia bacterium]|nr:hypothetical protein [Clostridia bacterium]
MEYGIIFLIVLLAMFYFQTIFSEMENKYLGYILPILAFITSVVLMFVWMDEFSIVKMLGTLLFVNIPTYILMLIYKLKRKKLKK